MPLSTSFFADAATRRDPLAEDAPPVGAHRRTRWSGAEISAGVHSTVWILAISAALTSRAVSKSFSSDQVGYCLPQPVADRVVLAGEERVQQAEAEPEVPGHAGQVDDLFEVARQLAVRVEPQLAVLVRAGCLR